MNHSIMISMRCLESPEYGVPPGTGYVKLSTYDREHGRSRQFLLSTETMDELINSSEEAYAADGYSFMMMSRVADWVRFRVTWLTAFGERVAGHIQMFDIPLEDLRPMLERFQDGLIIRFLYRRCMEREIVVQGNPKVYRALRTHLAAVLEELKRVEAGGEVRDELLETIRLINTTLNGMKEGKATSK